MFSAEYYPGGVLDHALEFALFGMARQHEWPKWVPMDHSDGKVLLHFGSDSKVVAMSEPCNWPEYNFEDPKHVPIYDGGQLSMARGDCYIPPIHKYVGRLPFKDGTVGGVIATHVLEHLREPRTIIREVSRVLAPGCPFNIVVPHADSNVYKHDLDHKSRYILDTWKNLLHDPYYDHFYGKEGLPFKIGVNFKIAIKEGNEMVVTQLVRK